MKRSILFIALVVTGLFISSCSKRIMEAMEVHKLHDTYFILRKNGHYSIKIMPMGMLRMPDSERGCYVLSNDTVYFVIKKSKNIYESAGYGIIDSVNNSFSYRNGDTAEWRTFELRKIPTRKEYKMQDR